MSSPKREKVTCPACKTLIDRWCWRTIDLRRHPEAYEKLKTGAYFKTLCPSCGRAVYEEYSMVCYDKQAGAFIQFVAGTDLEPFFYLDELLEEGQRLSKVNDREDFAEKVHILQHGRDDRIVEMCKFWTLRQFFMRVSGFDLERQYYSAEDGKELIVFENAAGERATTDFPKNLYRLFEAAYRDVLKRVKAKYDEYDTEWADGFVREHLDLLEHAAGELKRKGETNGNEE